MNERDLEDAVSRLPKSIEPPRENTGACHSQLPVMSQA